jgi:hypothetical protein
MTRHEQLRWQTLVLVVCSIFAFGCYDSSKSEEVGGHTNWLSCEQFADCAASADAVACDDGYCVDEHGARIAAQSSGASASADAQPLDRVEFAATFDGEEYGQLWGSSDDDIWALGGAVLPTSPMNPDHEGTVMVAPDVPCSEIMPTTNTSLLRHYDGQAWTRTEVESPGGLYSLHGFDSENVWAVGQSAVLRLQGTQWVEQDIADAIKHEAAPDCLQETVNLWSVYARAADDVWAVGDITPSILGRALIIHFDGTRWSRMPVEQADELHAVWASAADDAWAVGSNGSIYHYDGKQWRSADAGAVETLWSIWGGARDDVWASGYHGTLLHYDGAGWTAVSSSAKGDVDVLTGGAADDVWSIAYEEDGAYPHSASLMHWDGARWKVTPVSSAEVIKDIWISPSGKLWSAGSRIARRN